MAANFHDCQSPFQQDDDEFCRPPPTKKIKLEQIDEKPEAKRVVIVVPIMGERLDNNIDTYTTWSKNGFDIVFVFTKDDEKKVTNIVKQQSLYNTSIELHSYTPSTCPNAGIAKNAAYGILKGYLDQPDFMYALLLDDTVDDIIDTHTGSSCMSIPEEFCRVVQPLAEKSPVFGGTVAPKRHPGKCNGVVKGGFLQQAIIFACKGAPSLSKHFKGTDEYMYMTRMRAMSYKSVPFGEDVSFQIALYKHGVLCKGESAQFWGIGISRIRHISATKRSFDQLDDEAKRALKDMTIYLREQDVLSINPHTNELSGVKVMPRGRIRIPIRGKKKERPWREAYNYAFPSSKEK